MRRYRYVLVGLAPLMLVGGLALWRLLSTDFFWGWGGWRIVDWAQGRVHGQVQVRQVQGNPLTGLTFSDIVVQGPRGEVLRADRVEVRFSLFSFVKLQPVIAHLGIHGPRLTLREDQPGRWNVSGLFKETPPPPFSVIKLSQVLLKGGTLDLSRPGETQHFRDLELGLALTILNPKQPQEAIKVHRANLALTAPQGRFVLDTSFTYHRQRLDLKTLKVAAQDQPLITLAGEVQFNAGAPVVDLRAFLGPAAGDALHRLWPKWPGAWDLGGKFQVTGSSAQLRVAGEGSLEKAAYTLKGILRQNGGAWEYDLEANLSGLGPGLLTAAHKNWEPKLKDLEPLTASLYLKGAGLGWPPAKLE